LRHIRWLRKNRSQSSSADKLPAKRFKGRIDIKPVQDGRQSFGLLIDITSYLFLNVVIFDAIETVQQYVDDMMELSWISNCNGPISILLTNIFLHSLDIYLNYFIQSIFVHVNFMLTCSCDIVYFYPLQSSFELLIPPMWTLDGHAPFIEHIVAVWRRDKMARF